MNHSTMLALALLGAATPALASSDEGPDGDATYAQDLLDGTDHDNVWYRSGKKTTSKSSTSRAKTTSNGRYSSTSAQHVQTSRTTTAVRPGTGPGPRPAGAPASSSARPSGQKTYRSTTTSTTTTTVRPSTGPSRPPVAGSSGAPGRPGTTGVRPSGPPRPGVASTAVVPGRPGTAVRPGTVVRPGVGRPATVVTTRPGVAGRPVVVHRPVVTTVRYTNVRPYHGVFVYGPRPVTHVHYVHTGPGPVRVEKTDLPKRAIDREDSFALGLKGGSMISGTSDGQVYGDPGLGLVGRYRPAESLGLELGLSNHTSLIPATRTQTQLSGSFELFAFPWTRVSPYALAGVTWNGANVQSEVWNGVGYETTRTMDSQWGLHAGLGLEFGIGKSVAFDLEGRYIGWVDERLPYEAPGALQATAGLLVHFK